MNIDYANLEADVFEGTFRQRLEEELIPGFRQLKAAGERLPPPSYLASQIAAIVDRHADLSELAKYELYQEILAAVEAARATVLGEVDAPN